MQIHVICSSEISIVIFLFMFYPPLCWLGITVHPILSTFWSLVCAKTTYIFFFFFGLALNFILFDFFPLILPSYLTKTTRRECFLAPKTGITTVERWIMGIYDTLPDMICMLTFCVRVITIITGFVHIKYSMGFLIFAGLLCNWGGAIGLVLVIEQKHDTLLLSRGCYKPAWCLIFHLLCLSNLEGHMLR